MLVFSTSQSAVRFILAVFSEYGESSRVLSGLHDLIRQACIAPPHPAVPHPSAKATPRFPRGSEMHVLAFQQGETLPGHPYHGGVGEAFSWLWALHHLVILVCRRASLPNASFALSCPTVHFAGNSRNDTILTDLSCGVYAHNLIQTRVWFFCPPSLFSG